MLASFQGKQFKFFLFKIMENSSNGGYWKEYRLRRELMDMWNNVKDKYSVNGNEDEIRRYSIFAESCAAYKALSLVNGVDKRVDEFIEEYCSNSETRHECRLYLGSLPSPNLDEDKREKFNKYKSLTFLFSDSRDMMRSKIEEKRNEGFQKFKSALFKLCNELIHDATLPIS